MGRDFKRSLTIAGHRTSLSLEPEFWDALTKAAAARNMSLASLVSEIDGSRGERNLSSAVRVWLLLRAKIEEFPHPEVRAERASKGSS